MGEHRASKFISFSYGHRLLGHDGPCRHLHGHNARVEVTCRAPLDAAGMVVDFAEIRRVLEQWIDAHWDHRMILQSADPLLGLLRGAGEPVFELAAPSTAENLAAHLFSVAREAGLPVCSVRFWETPDSVASFTEA